MGGRTYRRFTSTLGAPFVPVAGTDVLLFGPSGQGVSTLGNTCPVTLGRSYSMAVPVRCSIAQRLRAVAQGVTATTGGNTKAGPEVTLVPGQWTLLIVEDYIPAMRVAAPIEPTVGLRVDVDTASAPIAWNAGNTLEVGRPYVYEGATLPPVMTDGDTPGWRWLGTVQGSESVGYPYTLESIAGVPYAQPLGAMGALAAPAAIAAKNKMLGRTIYVAATVNPGVLNAAASIRDAAATSRLSLSVDTNTYGVAKPEALPDVTASAGLVTAGIRVVAVTVPDGLAHVRHSRDAANFVQSVIPNAGAGISWNVYATSGSAIQSLFYDRPHSDETIKRISAWLARKYHGAPIPAGY